MRNAVGGGCRRFGGFAGCLPLRFLLRSRVCRGSDFVLINNLAFPLHIGFELAGQVGRRPNPSARDELQGLMGCV